MAMRQRTRELLVGAVLASALLNPGCGGGSGGDGGNGGPTNPGGSTLVLNEGWALEPLGIQYLDASITGTGGGTVAATVEWTFATNDVDLFITATACSVEQFVQDLCAFKAKADSTTAKPERVSFSVSGGDSYRFWIVNFGPARESGTFQAVLNR